MQATSFDSAEIEHITAALSSANKEFARSYPGESNRRQAVHTVYGGAHLFHADTAGKLGELALRSLQEYAPDAATFSAILGLTSGAKIYERVVEKLRREPVEDFRLDFEDGYGNRPDDEEDGHAASAARAVARGVAEGTLPAFIGVRIKPLSEDLRARSIHTLDIFMTALLRATRGALPEGFVITVPKIQLPEQITAAVRLLEILERKNRLEPGALKIEPMIETPQAIIDRNGRVGLHSIIEAGNGRCQSVHFGVYDHTASCGITVAHQTMRHPICDFARQVMLVSLAGTGVHLSDGATNILPVGNREAVHAAWRLGFENNMHSLRNGFFQGWDLHPAQLVTRYAALYDFFLGSLDSASERLKAFVERAALASLHGDVFDDAATGQGLLNFFLRGLACGAITEEEALGTGLCLQEIRSRSFFQILQGRRRS